MKANEFAKLIRPKVNARSDKYSWNFYRFMNLGLKSSDFVVLVDEKYNNFNPAFPRYSDMHVGFWSGDDLIGKSLLSVLNEDRHITTLSCFINFNKSRYVDITEWFCAEYPRRGRCLFDPDHSNWLQFPETRYSAVLSPIDGSERTDCKYCNWCGKMLFKFEKEIIKIEKRDVWVAM